MTQRPDNAIFFLQEMMSTLDRKIGIERKKKKRYTAQTFKDVMAVYDVCIEANPDIAIDVGTSWGASCMALAIAMKTLGKSLKCLTTINLHQKWWAKIMHIHRKTFKRYGVLAKKIKPVAADFATLDPKDYIPADAKVMIFYDIHDYYVKGAKPVSAIFLNKWIPCIKEGIVAVHDMTPVPDDWDIKKARHHHATMATYWNGGTFTGFAECAPIIEFVNSNRGKMTPVGDEIIWFPVKNGKPVRMRKSRKSVEVKDADIVHDLQAVPK